MLDFATTAFVSILFLADPPGNVPPFLALTARQSPEKRRKTARTACVVAALTLFGFAAVGTYLFHHLGRPRATSACPPRQPLRVPPASPNRRSSYRGPL